MPGRRRPDTGVPRRRQRAPVIAHMLRTRVFYDACSAGQEVGKAGN